MGLTGVQEDLCHLLAQKRVGTNLDIVVLTETKLTPSQHSKLWLKPLFDGWTTHFSSKPMLEVSAEHEHNRSDSAGVIIACRKSGTCLDFQRDPDVPTRFSGHLIMLKSTKHNLLLLESTCPAMMYRNALSSMTF